MGVFIFCVQDVHLSSLLMLLFKKDYREKGEGRGTLRGISKFWHNLIYSSLFLDHFTGAQGIFYYSSTKPNSEHFENNIYRLTHI